MEQRPIRPRAAEWSIERRDLLRRLAKSTVFLLAVPLMTRHVLPPTAQAAKDHSKGEDMNQGNSFFDDPYRLPRHVLPTRYDLRLEPDLAGATFQGRATIALSVRQATSSIVCNALELTVEEAIVEDSGGRRQPASVAFDEPLQRCRLTVSEPLAPGEWRLHVLFRGTLNDKLRGFYRSTYKDQLGTTL